MPSPIGIDLFAGAGGMSLGFEQAGFDIAAAVEIDPVHCAVHEFNFPSTAVICASVAGISGAEIRRRAGTGDAEIDVVFGGSPCQGFSLIGKRAMDDPRNALAGHFVRIVRELRPKYFVFENVKGLTVGKSKSFLDELIAEFDAAGYDVIFPWRVLNAADFGVPQSRQRLFLLGTRKGLPLPQYPAVRTRPAGSKSADTALPFGPSVADAIGDLPDADDFAELLVTDESETAMSEPENGYARRLRGLDRDSDDFSAPRAWNPSLLTSSMRTVHGEASKLRFAAAPYGTPEPVSRFFKLPPDGVSNTLRAGTGADRGAFTSPRPIHPFHPRCITVREMARLHSYPDWFRFHETKWHGARQIGNSVPPLLARAVASSVIAAIGLPPGRPTAQVELGDTGLLRLNARQAAARYGIEPATLPRRDAAGASLSTHYVDNT